MVDDPVLRENRQSRVDREKITRLDEKIKSLQVQINALEIDIKANRKDDSENYVTVEQFAPIKTFVYGLIGVILLAVAAAIMSLVLGGSSPIPPATP